MTEKRQYPMKKAALNSNQLKLIAIAAIAIWWAAWML